MATVFKGFLSFGMISVPVKLFAAARSERVSFNQVHAACGNKINQDKVCRCCNKKVEQSELVKGYEVEKGKMLTFTEDEIKGVAPKSSKTIEIKEFVHISDIDPISYDSSYFVVPEEAGKKPYQLLCAVMKQAGYAGVAKVTMFQREHAVVVRPYKSGLILHTLFYREEVRDIPEFSAMQFEGEVSEQESGLALMLLQAMTVQFDHSKYQDNYKAQILALIEAKKNGETVTPQPQSEAKPVFDLMAALQASLTAKSAATNPKTEQKAQEQSAETTKKPKTRKASGK